LFSKGFLEGISYLIDPPIASLKDEIINMDVEVI
jgi:hypothetical protein